MKPTRQPPLLEHLERRALLTAASPAAPIDDSPTFATLDIQPAAWSPVPAPNFATIIPAMFTDAELRYAQPLFWFHTVANSVVETTAAEPRGWIAANVWRDVVDNQPYNARVLENHAAFAFFYTTNRSWNPYYNNTQVKNRLEAILDLLVSMQNTSGGTNDGTWSEYSATGWGLAPTSFGLKSLTRTLELLNSVPPGGPTIDATIKQRVVDSTARGFRALLDSSDWLNAGNDYSNQYSAVWGDALRFTAMYPQYDTEFRNYINIRLPEAGTKHQSPAGFFYEAGGPDYAYTLGTHERNLTNGWHVLKGSAYQNDLVSEESSYWNNWVSYNLVRQPSGAGYFANYAATTRLTQRYFTVGNNEYPIAEFVPAARILSRTAADEASALTSTRSTLSSNWGVWGALNTNSSNSYPPTPFNDLDQVGWRPTTAERNTAISALPYYSETYFNQQNVDSRRPLQYTYIRRPTYYSSFNSGSDLGISRMGLGLMWNDTFGTAVLNQANTDTASYGTRASGATTNYEAAAITSTYRLNGSTFAATTGVRRLNTGAVSATYPLASAGSKAVTYNDSAVSVAITHTGSFTERIPMLRTSGETISITPGRVALTRGNVTFSITFPTSVTATKSTPSGFTSLGDGQQLELITLSASSSLTYSMQFEIAPPTSVSGDRDSANQADNFRLVRNGSISQLFLNSSPLPVHQWDSATGPSTFAINGLGGDDTLTLDLSGGNPLPTATGLSFNGGTGTTNRIILQDSAGNSTITLRAGQVSINTTTIAYASTQALDLNINSGTDVLDVTSNADVTATSLQISIAAGSTLRMNTTAVMPDFADLTALGTFDLFGRNTTLDSLSGSGTITNTSSASAATLTVGQQNSSSTFTGTLTNATFNLVLTKVGTGTLTLSGNNTYTGQTNINAGTLRITSPTALGTTAGSTWIAGGTSSAVLDLAASLTLNETLNLQARAYIPATTLFYPHLLASSGASTLTASVLMRGGGLGYNLTTGAATSLTLAGQFIQFDSQTYDRPVHLAGTGTGSITGLFRGNSGWDNHLVKLDSGTWSISQGLSPSGSATEATADTTVSAGTLILGSPTQAARLARGAVSITAGTLRLLDRPTASTTPTSAINSLTLSPTGQLDLTNHSLILHYTTTSPIASLISAFTQNLLTTNPDSLGLPTTLAISEAADLGLTDFAGLPVDESTVLLKYTYVGDANLDGQVDALDYERVDLAIGNTNVSGTAQGDLNYDGQVDALDYEQVDLNIGNGVGSPLGVDSPLGVGTPLSMLGTFYAPPTTSLFSRTRISDIQDLLV